MKIKFTSTDNGYKCGFEAEHETIIAEGKTKGQAAIRFIQKLNKSKQYLIAHKSKVL